MKLQIQSVIYGNQVDALVKAMKALQQAVKVYHRRVGDLQVRLIYGDSTPTPVLDEKTQKDIFPTIIIFIIHTHFLKAISD